MKLDDLLTIQAIAEKRAVPIDILENEYEYYSKSKDIDIKLLDLDLIHFIRIFLKLVEGYDKLEWKLIDQEKENTFETKEQIKKLLERI